MVPSLLLAFLTQNLRGRFPTIGSFEQGTAQGSGVAQGPTGVGSRTHEIEVLSTGLGRRISDFVVVVRGSELQPPRPRARSAPQGERGQPRTRASPLGGLVRKPGPLGAESKATEGRVAAAKQAAPAPGRRAGQVREQQAPAEQ